MMSGARRVVPSTARILPPYEEHCVSLAPAGGTITLLLCRRLIANGTNVVQRAFGVRIAWAAARRRPSS